MVDQELSEKNVQLQSSTAEEKIKILEQVQDLRKEKDQLQRRRNSVDEKLKSGSVLSPEVSQYSLEPMCDMMDHLDDFLSLCHLTIKMINLANFVP